MWFYFIFYTKLWTIWSVRARQAYTPFIIKLFVIKLINDTMLKYKRLTEAFSRLVSIVMSYPFIRSTFNAVCSASSVCSIECWWFPRLGRLFLLKVQLYRSLFYIKIFILYTLYTIYNALTSDLKQEITLHCCITNNSS